MSDRVEPHVRSDAALARTTVVSLVALAVMGCTSVQMTDRAADSGSARIHEVSITRTAILPGSPDRVFAFITAEDVLPKVLTGYGPLPAVIRTSEQTGHWDVPGSMRRVHLADGSSVREQVTAYVSPTSFAYRVWDFEHPVIRRLASQARGDWTFVPESGGTRVVWTYTFVAQSGVAALPLAAITQVLWRGYMDVCLQNAQAALGPVEAQR